MMAAGRADLSKCLVPDELRELVAPLLPWFAARPRGGWTSPRDEQGRVHRSGVRADQRLWPGGICRRRPARPARPPPPHIAASRHGPRSACGVGCIGRCWTNSRSAHMHECLALKPLVLGIPAVRPPRTTAGAARQLRADKAYFSAVWTATWTAVASTIVRAHRHAAGARKKRGATGGESEARAVGRSRGDLPTKAHLAADGRCRPLAFVLTPGQTGDAPAFEYVMAALRVPRRRGRPRTRPALVLTGDKIAKPDRSADGRRRSAEVGLRGREPSV